MQNQRPVRIEAIAAQELARWKALFAAEVCRQAKQLAEQTGERGLVTLKHYRQAAEIALQSLSAAIHEGDAGDAKQRAA